MNEEIKKEIENPQNEQKRDKLTPIDLRKASNAQIEHNLLELEKYNISMEDFFNKQREKINNELSVLFAILGTKNYKDFIELQSQTLALRQQIQEQISFYMQKLSKANTKYKQSNADRVEYYMTGFGIKVTDSTRTKFVDRDISERNRNVESFQTHIEHLRECRNACDQINYAVKNMVGLISYINVLGN